MNSTIKLKPVAPKPQFRITHCGDIHRHCFECPKPPTDFIVICNGETAAAQFYCADCFRDALYKYYPDGKEPQELM